MPSAIAPEAVGTPVVRVDQQVFLQGRDLPVDGELITAIKGRCGVGKHLDYQLGVAQEQLGLVVAFVAGDENVGVEESVCCLHFDLLSEI